MSKVATQKSEEEKKVVVLYDADAKNRFAYSVVEAGEKFQTAHVFEVLDDDRYLQWIREFKLKGDEQEMSEESREASIRLWDDLITEVENIEDTPNWKELLPFKEKINALNDFLAVSPFEPDAVGAEGGKRRLTGVRSQTVLTEAYFNGAVTRQTHVLQEATLEWSKKYSRIQGKRFKQEATKGLRRKPKVEFVPQDLKLGQLYDEMCISNEGFASRVPLRFKTAVVEFIFEAEIEREEKK